MENVVEYDKLVHELTLKMIKNHKNYNKVLKDCAANKKTKSEHNELKKHKIYIIKTLLGDLKKQNSRIDRKHMTKDSNDMKALTDYLGIE